jgi:hypothetical protein
VVYYIPKLNTNIVSVGRLDEDGYHVLIGGGELAIHEPGGRLLAKVKWSVSILYLLIVKLSSGACLAARGETEAWRWHGRLAHLNFLAMKKMVRENLMRGLLNSCRQSSLVKHVWQGSRGCVHFQLKFGIGQKQCSKCCTTIFATRSPVFPTHGR